MPVDLKAAERMIDLFTSVGARSFVLTKLDVEENFLWSKPYSVRELRDKLGGIVRAAGVLKPHTLKSREVVMAGENVMIRPIGPDIHFIQLDDLKPEHLEKVRAASCVMHNTSPGKNQAWIAISKESTKDETKVLSRRIRKALGAGDASATGSTRLAGTENWKTKYLPEPPVISIVDGVPGRVMTEDRLRGMGIIAEPEPVAMRIEKPAPRRVSPNKHRQLPSYAMCLAGAPPNAEGTGPSRSHADFWWCKLAAQRGFTVEEIADELLNVSEKALQRMKSDPGYVTTTARNGWAAYERDRMRGRGVG